MNAAFLTALLGLPGLAFAQNPVTLPAVAVHSPRVANQTPGATFAMPVSALRFEPLVDIQPRNLAEGQADITLRGGVFENTGFQLGAVTVGDPQTGHYFAELPVAPLMLGAPEIVTGADLIFGATNATVGTIRQNWRPVRNAGSLSLGLGENRLRQGDVYQGYVCSLNNQTRLGADVSIAHSQSDGSVPFGDHRFDRINARIQLIRGRAQTDLFAGYQAKFFGWPNLYTPFNSNESENLQTSLFVLNHRVALETGDFIEAGLSHRRNKDDYAFNRFAPVGRVHPFQHTTWVTGGAVTGRQTIGALAFNYRAEHLADKIESTSLLFGRFNTRRFTKLALVPEKTWGEPADGQTTARAGMAFDDTNRDSSAVSPVVELVRTFPSGRLRRVHASFIESSQVATYTALNSSATAGLFRGNPDLGRQTSRNLELGIGGQLGGWSGNAAIFLRRDRALVDWTFRRGVTARTANAVDVDVGGLELVARRSWSSVDVTLGYTGLTKDADYRVPTVEASFYALNYARHRFTAALTARLIHGFEVRLDNVARFQAANLLRTIGGDDALSSALGLAYRPRAWRGLEVAVQVENLWDSDFQDVPAVPAARRQMSFRLAYGW